MKCKKYFDFQLTHTDLRERNLFIQANLYNFASQ